MPEYTVTRTYTIVEKWYGVTAASEEEAEELCENNELGTPDKDDGHSEYIDVELEGKKDAGSPYEAYPFLSEENDEPPLDPLALEI